MTRNANDAATDASTEITSWLDENDFECSAEEVPARVVEEDIRRAAQNTADHKGGYHIRLTDWDVTDKRLDVTFFDEDNLRRGYGDERAERLFDTARNSHHITLVAEDDESDQQAAIDLLAETLDEVLDEESTWTPAPGELVDDETRENVHRALERAQENAIVDWGPEEALWADDEWLVVQGDRDEFKHDIRDEEVPEWADRGVLVDWMQAAHDRVAAEVSGDPHLGTNVDVFVAARTADEEGDEDEPKLMTDGGVDMDDPIEPADEYRTASFINPVFNDCPKTAPFKRGDRVSTGLWKGTVEHVFLEYADYPDCPYWEVQVRTDDGSSLWDSASRFELVDEDVNGDTA